MFKKTKFSKAKIKKNKVKKTKEILEKELNIIRKEKKKNKLNFKEKKIKINFKIGDKVRIEGSTTIGTLDSIEKNKAIVIMGASFGKLNGFSSIYFLEKKNGNWIIKYENGLSIS